MDTILAFLKAKPGKGILVQVVYEEELHEGASSGAARDSSWAKLVWRKSSVILEGSSGV
jgi:hypothetical protein